MAYAQMPPYSRSRHALLKHAPWFEDLGFWRKWNKIDQNGNNYHVKTQTDCVSTSEIISVQLYLYSKFENTVLQSA